MRIVKLAEPLGAISEGISVISIYDYETNKYQYQDLGCIYALCIKIEQYLGMIPNQDFYYITNDLEELKSLNISVNQKITLINHMYQQYSFLN